MEPLVYAAVYSLTLSSKSSEYLNMDLFAYLIILANPFLYLIVFRWCWLPGLVNVGQVESPFSIVSL